MALADLLLLHGADSSLRNPNNRARTALHQAAAGGYTGLLVALLRAGVDPNEQDSNGATALLLVCVQGNHMAIKPLIDAKAALDVQDHEDETALTAACSEGHRRAAETLIAVGASVNRCCAGNTTPLMIAIRENYIGLAEALIKFKANVDDMCTSGNSSLMLAVQNNHEKAAALLIKHGANVDLADGNGYTSLLVAINMQWNGTEEYKHVELATLLLNARASTDMACCCHGRGPLIGAVGKDDMTLCRLLVEHGADKEQIDQRGGTPLLEAMFHGNVGIVEILLASGASTILTAPFEPWLAGTSVSDILSKIKISGMDPKVHRAWCKRRDQILTMLRQVTPGDTASALIPRNEEPDEALPSRQETASSKKQVSSKKTKKSNNRGRKGLARPQRQHPAEEDEGKEDVGEQEPAKESVTDDGSADPPSVAGRHGTASSGCSCEKCVGGRESLHAEGASLRPGLAELTSISLVEIRGGVLDFVGLQNNCACCGSPPPEGKRHPACRGCRLVRYCSVHCQKTAWIKLGHKKSCGRPLPSMETTFVPILKEFLEAETAQLCETTQLCEFGRSSSPLALITIRLMRMRMQVMHMRDESMQFPQFIQLQMAGATNATQKALEAHPHHLELALQGLSFLAEGIMALQQQQHNNFGFRLLMGDKAFDGIIDCALSAMQVHSQQSAGEVQQVACVLLATVASDTTERTPPVQLIVQAGGLRAIVAAMLKHTERRLLQLAGCRALRKVVTNSDDECIRAVKAEPGLVKAVQAALKAYPDDYELHECSGEVLRCISVSPDGLLVSCSTIAASSSVCPSTNESPASPAGLECAPCGDCEPAALL